MELSLQILFYFFIFTVFYSYAGYGILISIISRVPFLIRLMPKPANAVPSKLFHSENIHVRNIILEEEFYPTVSLIISASGETKETLREKIQNTKELLYPRKKLEVFFAIAFDSSDENETIDEFYDQFIDHSQNENITSKEEEVYIRFIELDTHKVYQKSRSIEVLEEVLSSVNFDSEGLKPDSKLAIDNYGTLIESDNTNELKIFVTKDIERKGKVSQVNRTIEKATGEILVFSDSNTFFNKEALINLTRHFNNLQVGCVAGEKRVRKGKHSTSGDGEGLYWKYESMLKKADSKIWTTVGAAGEIYAIRKSLWEKGEGARSLNNAIIEDFVVSMRITEKGYRVIYEPEAYAEEEPTKEIKDEFTRRKRIAAGGFQSIVWLKGLLNIFKYRTLSFQYISHRVLRWAVVPFLLPVILLMNILLIIEKPGIILALILLMQAGIYLLAAGGSILERNKKKIKIFNIPYMLLMMNISSYYGLTRFLKGSQTSVWEKVSR